MSKRIQNMVIYPGTTFGSSDIATSNPLRIKISNIRKYSTKYEPAHYNLALAFLRKGCECKTMPVAKFENVPKFVKVIAITQCLVKSEIEESTTAASP
jgi:hypothetical protein